MLPMTMRTADGEVALGPNNLTFRLEPADRQGLLHLTSKETRMPGIRDVTGKEAIGLGPIQPIVIRCRTFSMCGETPASLDLDDQDVSGTDVSRTFHTSRLLQK